MTESEGTHTLLFATYINTVVEHKSKMRLLKAHPHTSGRRGYEAAKKRQVKREERRPIRKGQKKRHGKQPLLYHLEGGAGGNRVEYKIILILAIDFWNILCDLHCFSIPWRYELRKLPNIAGR